MELSEDPDLQPILLGLFLSMYLVTVLGNLLIILTVSSDSHLHNPMYFFLSNLSLTDICFISTTDPKMLVNIQTHSRAISYVGCLTQMSLFIIFGCMNDMLLTMMAYDYFMGICQPLHYQVIMNPRLCGLLVLVSFFLGFLESLLHNLVLKQYRTQKPYIYIGILSHGTLRGPDLQPIFFGLFLSMFLVTGLGNLLIILAGSSDFHLHTPMYFFLSNLSLTDLYFIATTVPNMMMDIQTHSSAIFYEGCLTEMSFFILFGNMDNMLLTMMAYDQFVIICHPLHYPNQENGDDTKFCCHFQAVVRPPGTMTAAASESLCG
ncbi:olfactory receptor 1D5-like [Sciurus carolinensis]|uniref:olfactory receptor 1D5-like n=1 Tax=Sciurus carolinensis TaxID=30640 RepID=UPI001FB30801|nr:olfactory receptor 1D5-like [Sciurus carolinensis]